MSLLREAALTAMRRSIDAANVTAADLATAGETVRASLDRLQVATLRKFGTKGCLLYTSPSPRDVEESRMPSSA
nr:hypothetical protein [Escherichia coli]